MYLYMYLFVFTVFPGTFYCVCWCLVCVFWDTCFAKLMLSSCDTSAAPPDDSRGTARYHIHRYHSTKVHSGSTSHWWQLRSSESLKINSIIPILVLAISSYHTYSCTLRHVRVRTSLAYILPYEGGAMAAGPASRLGSTEPREKTGLRLSP